MFKGQMYDPHFQGIFHLSNNYLKLIVDQSKGEILQRVIRGSFSGATTSFVIPCHHRFFESFDKKTQQAVAAGIIDHFADDFKDLTNKKRFSHLKLVEEVPMSLEHLEAAFWVWLVSLVIPTAAFIAEWIFKLMDLKEFFLFRFIFTTYIKVLENNDDTKKKKTFEKVQNLKNKTKKKYEMKKHKSSEERKNKQTNEAKNYKEDQLQDTFESIYNELVFAEVHEEPIVQQCVDDGIDL